MKNLVQSAGLFLDGVVTYLTGKTRGERRFYSAVAWREGAVSMLDLYKSHLHESQEMFNQSRSLIELEVSDFNRRASMLRLEVIRLEAIQALGNSGVSVRVSGRALLLKDIIADLERQAERHAGYLPVIEANIRRNDRELSEVTFLLGLHVQRSPLVSERQLESQML